MMTKTVATTTTTAASVTPTPIPTELDVDVPELARKFTGATEPEADAVNETLEDIEIVVDADAPAEGETDGGGDTLDVSEIELDREVDDVLLAVAA